MPTPIRQFKDSSNVVHDLDNRFITLTSTTGTLTEEQVSLLQESDQNYIVYNSYIYRKLAETSTAMFYSMQSGNSPTTFIFSVVLVDGSGESRGNYSRTSVSYSLPLAANGTRGGIQIGYSESGTNYAVKLSSEKAYVTVPWTDTTYSAGTGLSLSGTKFNHSNSVTAGTAGTSSATSGSTLAVPYVTYDAQGHVTASGTHTHTVTGFSTTDTKNTAGSTDTSSKIFLVGATSQAANPQTYSDNQVYATNGQLDANKVRIAEAVTMVYDSTNKCINFNFS